MAQFVHLFDGTFNEQSFYSRLFSAPFLVTSRQGSLPPIGQPAARLE